MGSLCFWFVYFTLAAVYVKAIFVTWLRYCFLVSDGDRIEPSGRGKISQAALFIKTRNLWENYWVFGTLSIYEWSLNKWNHTIRGGLCDCVTQYIRHSILDCDRGGRGQKKFKFMWRHLLWPLTCVNAHDKLYQDDQGQQEVDGGKCNVVRKVYLLTLTALELDLAVAGTVKTDAVPGAVVTAPGLHA